MLSLIIGLEKLNGGKKVPVAYGCFVPDFPLLVRKGRINVVADEYAKLLVRYRV